MTSTVEPITRTLPPAATNCRRCAQILYRCAFGLFVALSVTSAVIHNPWPLFVLALALLIAIISTALSVAALLPPPRPLTERSLLANQIAWLWRFLFGALVVGISAFVGSPTFRVMTLLLAGDHAAVSAVL